MTPEMDAQHRAQLAETLERDYGCKPGMIHEGYGAECASHAHAPALYRTFGCDHVARIADSLASLVAEWLADARVSALRIPRLVEADMAQQAAEAWKSADARRGLSDHDALLVHADALTRWSERLRMAFDGEDYRDDRGGDS